MNFDVNLEWFGCFPLRFPSILKVEIWSMSNINVSLEKHFSQGLLISLWGIDRISTYLDLSKISRSKSPGLFAKHFNFLQKFIMWIWGWCFNISKSKEDRIDFGKWSHTSYSEDNGLNRKKGLVKCRIENEFFKNVSGVKNFWIVGKKLVPVESNFITRIPIR